MPAMNQTTYELCHKPVVGLLMWVASMCTFPPLFQDMAIDMVHVGASAAVPFEVGVDLDYTLVATFAVPPGQAERVRAIVGTGYNAACAPSADRTSLPQATRAAMGRELPFKVVVRRVGETEPVFEGEFASLCSFAQTASLHYREVARVPLTRGHYTIEITNLSAQPDLADIAVSIALTPAHGK